MKIRSLLQTSLTLMLLASCAGSNLPNASTPQPNNGSAQNAAQPNQNQISSSSSAEMQQSLTALHEDEAIYDDTVTVAQAEAGFSTQALEVNQRLDTRVVVKPTVVRPVIAVGGRPASAQQTAQVKMRAAAALKLNQAQRAQLRANLKASDAVTLNEDGTITLDPAKFKQEVKAHLQQQVARLEQHLLKIKARLELKHEIKQELQQRLRHHDYAVRTSDKVSVTNEDGSISETIKVSFKNTRLNIERETTLTKTSLDGKLLEVDFQLSEKTPAFERTLSRVATYNNDGSKTVLIDAKTSWKNGRSHERHEERLVSSDGSATGAGTITRTDKAGNSKTFSFKLSLTAQGEMISSASDNSSQTEVTLDENADGSATAMVETNGQESSSEIDIEAEAEASTET